MGEERRGGKAARKREGGREEGGREGGMEGGKGTVIQWVHTGLPQARKNYWPNWLLDQSQILVADSGRLHVHV